MEAPPRRHSFLVAAINCVPAVLDETGRLLATPFAVVTGLTYNFLPFMVLPLYASLEKIDPRLHGGRRRPLRLAVHDLPAGDPAAGHARAWWRAPC